MVVIKEMPQKQNLEVRGKVGKALQYGKKRYGYFKYGQQYPVFGAGLYGQRRYGIEHFAEAANPWGIYQVRSENGKQIQVKMRFYIPGNPQTVEQQANRSTFADAVEAWQGLTDEEKKQYNKDAEGKPLSGYNLYIREYMLSN